MRYASELRLPAPAKLNLFLHLTGRRADGYHLLQTVFQLLDWGDQVFLRLRDDDCIRMLQPVEGVDDQSNLALRAAHKLRDAVNGDWGVDIAIDKRIPMGAGLGGSSSDAASTLVGLNRLLNLGKSEGDLSELGLALGADVPLFVGGNSAWAEGIGEILTPIQLTQPWFLIVHPAVSVSTAEVYSDTGLTRDTAQSTISCFVNGDRQAFRNDLAPAALRLAPVIGEALSWLGHFEKSQMSGSGSSVFAEFDTRGAAEAVAAQVPKGWSAFVARGVNRSPLHAYLDLQLEEAKRGTTVGGM